MGHKKEFFYKKTDGIIIDLSDYQVFKTIIMKDPLNITKKLGKKAYLIINGKQICLKRKNKKILEIDLNSLINWKKKTNGFELYFVNYSSNTNSITSSSDDQIIRDNDNDDREYVLGFSYDNFDEINKSIYKFLGQYMVHNELISYEEYLYWTQDI
ncbi:hypothetical protein CPAV1605_927 [seawater metagenome]|uniref:Uncharacterized protein n=1 Tax=seawater metagenome TaxID=1561972 RepID=A0A5E8CM06_9ZZZZ